MNRQNSRFRRGETTFTCACCGRLTRATGVQSVGSELCPDDYELAGIYNTYQDEGEEGVLVYANDVRHYAANIVAKGGKLDGDAEQLLEIVNRK